MTRKKKRRQKLDGYIKDLRAMSTDAYILCDPDKKSCNDCSDLLKCMNGVRNAVGDLAETLAWTLEQIILLDDTMSISIESAKDFLEETGIHVDKMTKKAKKKKKKKKKEIISQEASGFYT